MAMIGWWEWQRHKQTEVERKKEAKTRTKDHAKASIEWALPADLLPLRERTSRYGTSWFIRDSTKAAFFVYVLKDEAGAIRYVGLSDDPPRRHMEHRRKETLPLPFTMVVVEVGHREAEKAWIAKCISDGCNILNLQGTANHQPTSTRGITES